MISPLAMYLLLQTSPATGPTAPARDEEIVRNLELLENWDLLDQLDVISDLDVVAGDEGDRQ